MIGVVGSPSLLDTGGAHAEWRLNDTRPAAGRTRGRSSEFTSLDRDEDGGGGYGADPASSWTGSSLPINLHAPNTGIWRGPAAPRRSRRVRDAARLRGPVSVCARRVGLAQRAGAQAAVGVDEALPPRTSRPGALQVEAAGAEDDAVALDVGDHVALAWPRRGCRPPAPGPRSGRTPSQCSRARQPECGELGSCRLLPWHTRSDRFPTRVLLAGGAAFSPLVARRVGAAALRETTRAPSG